MAQPWQIDAFWCILPPTSTCQSFRACWAFTRHQGQWQWQGCIRATTQLWAQATCQVKSHCAKVPCVFSFMKLLLWFGLSLCELLFILFYFCIFVFWFFILYLNILEQQFSTDMPQESLKHTIPDQLVRGTDLFSLHCKVKKKWQESAQQ